MADASTTYSFIDVAAWDGVRENFLSGRPIAVFSEDMRTLLWANGRAAQLFGFATIGEFEAEGPAGMGTALRQIVSAAARAKSGGDVATHIRVSFGIRSQVLPAKLRAITGRDGMPCVVLVIDTGETDAAERDAALAAIAGLATEGAGAAIVDDSGALLAADALFSGITLPADAIGALVRDVRDEKDRLVKRLVTPDPAIPVAIAIARLTDTPARHLVMAVKSASDEPAGDEPAQAVEEAVSEERLVVIPQEEVTPQEEVLPGAPVEMSDAATVEPSPADEPAEDVPVATTPEPEPAEEAMPVAPEPQETVAESPSSEPAKEADSEFTADFENGRGPVRFVWKTDSVGRFTDISPEFAAAVGPRAADIVGRAFEDVARDFDLDPSGEIDASLKRHDTWSGKSVLWPVQGTVFRVPVDLAALPSYNRQRDFEGYRGFGIVRMGERKPDPNALGLKLVETAARAPVETEAHVEPATPADDVDILPEAVEPSEPPQEEDPFAGEVPALSTVAPLPMRRESDKIIDLESKRRSQSGGETLNPSEQAAFRQIGDVLGWARVKKESADTNKPERELPAATFDDRVSEDLPADETPEDGQDYIAASAEDAEGEIARDIEMEIAADDIGDGAPPLAVDEEASEENHDYMPSAFATSASGAAGRVRSEDGLTPAFLNALPLPILIHRDDEALFANEAFAAMSGYRDAGGLNEAGGIDALFDGETAEDGALTLRVANGVVVSARAHMQTVPWHGRTALMFAFEPQMAHETEAPPQQGEELDLSEAAELRAILDTASDGVVVLSRDGVIRSLNASASALFGYANEEVEGKSFSVLFAHESQAAALDYLGGLANNGVASVLNEGLEVLGREKNGGFLPLFMTIGRLETSNGFCAVVRDITAWKQTEQALRDAQRNAEQASSYKTEFLAKISHEIRTPLNAIIGFSELMAEERFGPIGNERYKSYLTDINKSGKYVLDLVNDLLDISKIEAGKQELEFESVSLNDAVNEAITMIQPQANRSRIIIRSSLDDDLPDVVADQRSLKQIVLNVLSNSVRFTHSGGQVIVNTSYNARGEVVLRMKDTGIGMSPKEIDLALQPFQQVASLGRARGDGTGLGLPLTKALVEANRAEFAIQSEPGKGTAVEIVFPPSRVLAS